MVESPTFTGSPTTVLEVRKVSSPLKRDSTFELKSLFSAIFFLLFSNNFLNAKKSLPILGIKINNLDIWEEELVQEESFKRIGYSKSGVEKLKNIRKKAYINSDSYESFFDYLINNLDFNNLGIYEANNLLNMQAKAQYQKNFNSLGIDLNYQETNDNGIVFTYSYNNKDRYEVSEDSGKIKVLKL